MDECLSVSRVGRARVARTAVVTMLVAVAIAAAPAGRAIADEPALADPPVPGKVFIPACSDTYLRAGAPNTNEGGSPFLRMQASGNNRVLVRFDPEVIREQIAGRVVTHARIEVCVVHNGFNWGKNADRKVSVHRLTSDWAEGSDARSSLRHSEKLREGGIGATWNVPFDPNLSNQNDDDALPWGIKLDKPLRGGSFDPDPSFSQVIDNDMVPGTHLYWDVTDDVLDFQDELDGLDGEDDTPDHYGWIFKKDLEGLAGEVIFASREFDDFWEDEYVDANGDPIPCPFTMPMLVLDVEDAPGMLTLLAEADTYLRGGAQNTNEGANTLLQIQSSGDNRILVRFSDIPNAANVTKATLVFTIQFNADNWGTTNPDGGDRPVDAHRLLVDWAEGNGSNDHTNPSIRGTGEGATWNLPVDPDINNSSTDGVTPQWNGGTLGTHFAAATSPSVFPFNGQVGEVSWDVTADVKDGADFGWLVKRSTNSGRMDFFSTEGAALAAALAGDDETLRDLALKSAPRLILKYGNGD